MNLAETPSASTPSHQGAAFDRVLLECVRGGRVHASPPTDATATVSVVVIALGHARPVSRAVRDALAQTHRVAEVLVVGPTWDAAAGQRLLDEVGHDGRVRLLQLARLGPAPAAPRDRHRVHVAQALGAALPFVTGDWVTVVAAHAPLEASFVAHALEHARRDVLELVWSNDDPGLADRDFAGVLWASALAALVPSSACAWAGEAPDAMWWTRLQAAGARAPGAPLLPRALARRGHA